MRSIELDSGQFANGLVASGDWFAVYALRKEFPTAPIPEDENEPDRWLDFLNLDDLEDAITVRYISIDWQRQTAILFYERGRGWCFEHRCYMTEVEKEHDSHFELHGYNEGSYYDYLYTKGEEIGAFHIRHSGA